MRCGGWEVNRKTRVESCLARKVQRLGSRMHDLTMWSKSLGVYLLWLEVLWLEENGSPEWSPASKKSFLAQQSSNSILVGDKRDWCGVLGRRWGSVWRS